MPTYVEFEVEHLEIKPRIWRRFLLPIEGSTFLDLHRAIQDAGPWLDYHLHRFDEPGRGGEPISTTPGQGEPMFVGDVEIADSDRVTLASYFTGDPLPKCEYWYDFGDDWRLKITMKNRQELDDVFYRRLTAGRRAFPIEDSGGPFGYSACIASLDPKIMNDKNLHPEDKADLVQRKKWLAGMDWLPDTFDLKTAKRYFDADCSTRLSRPFQRLDQSVGVYRPDLP